MAESESQFPETPAGWAQRWQFEFSAAKKALKKFQDQGDKIIERFLDERGGESDADVQRWNLFTANVQTQEAMLFGSTPATQVSRRFADAKDEVARVGAEELERLLNTDLEHDGEGQVQAYRQALGDRLRPGLGVVRHRYVCEFETKPAVPAVPKLDELGQPMLDAQGQPVLSAPEVPEQQVKSFEDVETCYVYWKDMLWDAGARIFADCRWWAFRVSLSKDEATRKFGEKVVPELPRAKATPTADSPDVDRPKPWDRIEVWEIWDKEHEKVFWFCEGYPTVLRPVDVDAECVNADGSLTDPLELDGFWPFQRPLMANLTTSKLIPKGDFHFAQDLYNEIDTLSTRIVSLERAIKVAGVYDSEATDAVQQLVEASDNKLIPVPNWSRLMEKGGVVGSIQWMPLAEVVDAINQLDSRRAVLIGAMQQITGWSDLVRGQQAENGTPGEAQIKARFASVRLQALQDELIRFVTDGQRLRAEIICKHFDVETILERSNAARMSDGPDLAMAGARFLKEQFSCYRIDVKPDSVSMQDFARIKSERMEMLEAIGGFFQQAMPIVQAMPGSMPFLLELLQWTVSGLRGSGEAQGILDRAIALVEQQQQQQAGQPHPPAPPDPRLMAAQIKAQSDAQKIQLQAQADLQHMQAETQAITQRQQAAAALDVQKEALKQRIKQGAVQPPSPFGPIQGGMP